MRIESLHDEAEACRRTAALFVGKPEATFLLRIASSFEQLAMTSEGGTTAGNYGSRQSRRAAGELLGVE